jgi:hypothetical protein
MMRSLPYALVLGIVFSANCAFAQAGFQLGVPGARIPNNPDVSGVRLSVIHGENRNQRGLDLGLLSMSETANLSGLALIGGVSRVTQSMSGGAALSLVNWHTGKDSGMNGAFINVLNDTTEAFNVGFVTIASGGTMVDLGGFNMSRSSVAQIGFLNVTDRIEGFQFGFVNMAKNGVFPILPVVNFAKK